MADQPIDPDIVPPFTLPAPPGNISLLRRLRPAIDNYRELNMIRPTLAAGVLLALGASAHAQQGGAATASFVNVRGETIGDAKISALQTGVLIEIDLSGLTPEGWVSFHIHETGSCDPASDFESAGGHFNPEDASHGFMVEGGPHPGDMPNQYVGSGGILKSVVYNSRVTLEAGAGITGKALMIHGGQDDYKTQPSGDAGPRLACAVIE